MNPLFERAQLLYQQGRYDLAADALREFLSQSPQDAYAHALLGLCLVKQKKYDEATAEAQLAIHQAPDFPFSHYALGAIYLERNRFPETEAAAREAVRLSPEDADYWSLLAQSLFAQQRWQETLDAADSGLQHDPEHTVCINLRAMALVKLGDRQAASVTIQGALKLNPQSALSHANQGWTLLHQNDPKKALEHFREALRLDPNNQWARDGTIEALKARHLLYRIMLRYYLWMSRFSSKGQWGIVIGLWVGVQVLKQIQISHPELAVFIYPLLIAYGVFVLASWLAGPIFNLTLLFNPFGRYLLSTAQRVGALVVGFEVLAAVILIPLGLLANLSLPLVFGIFMAVMTLPTAATARCRVGLPLSIMVIYTLGLFLAGIAGIAMLITHQDGANSLLLFVVLGSILSGVVGNILLGLIPKK